MRGFLRGDNFKNIKVHGDRDWEKGFPDYTGLEDHMD